MANPSFTVNVKGSPVTFVSAFATLAEAYKALDAEQLKNITEFGQSLLAAARARRLSPVQIAWLHKLATDAQTGGGRVVADLDLSPVLAMMDKAAGAQKRAPKVVLQLSSGCQLVLRMVMQGSNVGEVSITNGLPWGHANRVYFGKVSASGTQKSGSWTNEVEALLRQLAANPAAVAAQHGVATGVCCFCNTPLSTAESRSVGYGPVCADKFGLPWGDTSVADAADAVAKEALRDQRDADYESACESQEAKRTEERLFGRGD